MAQSCESLLGMVQIVQGEVGIARGLAPQLAPNKAVRDGDTRRYADVFCARRDCIEYRLRDGELCPKHARRARWRAGWFRWWRWLWTPAKAGNPRPDYPRPVIDPRPQPRSPQELGIYDT